MNGLLHAEWTTGNGVLGDWTLATWLDNGAGHDRFDPHAFEDILVVCQYSLI